MRNMLPDKDLTDDVLDEIIAGAKTSMEQYLALSLKAERAAMPGKSEPVSQPVAVPDGKPSFGAMMRALDAFYADEDVPENAMLAAFKILLADVREHAAQPVREVNNDQ